MPIFMMKELLWSTLGSATRRTRIPILSILLQHRKDAIPVERDLERGGSAIQRTRIPIMSILLQHRKDAIPVEQDLEHGRGWKKLGSSIFEETR
ncbi:hypothetical protein QYE76_006916 [Lolium multiflorum]|uniref:Uncharacterized protein n=1 Tax=Lolium multiflorum TaxID=4521 RepID=A0AAD8RVW8_LOLMU|nr:hypothetical protein QYE76_006916 [Lolium multiflorum]